MGGVLYPVSVHDDVLRRGQARRIARRFTEVGVPMTAARLQQISAGAPVIGKELIDLKFALTATMFEHERRLARYQHARHRCARWTVVGAMILVALAALIAMTVLTLTLAQPRL